jgi:hypothetical protein
MTPVAKTGWILVHPIKGADWASITYQEDRPGGLLVEFSQWAWRRVVVRLDETDQLSEGRDVHQRNA